MCAANAKINEQVHACLFAIPGEISSLAVGGGGAVERIAGIILADLGNHADLPSVDVRVIAFGLVFSRDDEAGVPDSLLKDDRAAVGAVGDRQEEELVLAQLSRGGPLEDDLVAGAEIGARGRLDRFGSLVGGRRGGRVGGAAQVAGLLAGGNRKNLAGKQDCRGFSVESQDLFGRDARVLRDCLLYTSDAADE